MNDIYLPTPPAATSAQAAAMTASESGFNYVGLADEKARALQAGAARIRSLVKRSTADIIAIGQELLEAKKVLAHGDFGPWVARETNLSKSSAERFMRVAKWTAGKCVSVTNLEPTAIYLLSAPSTPAEAQSTVIARLEDGQRLSPDVVRTIVAKARNARRQAQGEARLSLSARRRRVQRRKQHDEQRKAWQRRRDEERRRADAAADELVAMLWNRLQDDRRRFLELVDAVCVHHGLHDLARRLTDGGGP